MAHLHVMTWPCGTSEMRVSVVTHVHMITVQNRQIAGHIRAAVHRLQVMRKQRYADPKFLIGTQVAYAQLKLRIQLYFLYFLYY